MTAIQICSMNPSLWQGIEAIADSEPLMRKLTKYVARLVKEKKDASQMTEVEFYAKIARAEQQAANGEGMEMLSGENLTDFLRRNGYDV